MSVPWEITADQARRIVHDAAERNGWISQEDYENSTPASRRAITHLRSQLGTVTEMIARDIYSRKARFVLELIQNAEDNKFTRAATLREEPFIKFDIYPTKIVVECNEDGFTEANVGAICRIGASSKQNKRGYIGEKGIGFKSVFQVASKVHIQSNAFSFYFQYGGGDNENRLAIITPIWVNDEAPDPNENPLTRMTLTLSQGTDYNDMISQIQDVPEDLLLFLSTLKRLEINLHQPNLRVISTKYCKSDASEDGKIRLTKTIEDSNDGGTSCTIENIYYITKKDLSNLPRERVRQDIHDCEVVLAFPLDIAGGMTRPLISDQHVFAFLPIRKFGFNFVIQSDFILQASRQDILESARNKAILQGVADAFCTMVLQFSRPESPLRYEWMKYMPSQQNLDAYWAPLPHMITSILEQHKILLDHTFQRARRPEEVRLLRDSQLDIFGNPLFEDHPASGWKSLSRSYEAEAVATLRKAFDLPYVDDNLMFSRIRRDLLATHSKLKDITMDADWTTKACNLIRSILRHSAEESNKIRGLPLIPLINGEWVRPVEGTEQHFPATIGPSIPGDLVTTVDPDFVRNQARKSLLGDLGVTQCRPGQVIEKLWNHYLRNGGAANLEFSKIHLRYLYWHHHEPSSGNFGLLGLYDCNGGQVVSRRRVLYLRNDDRYGPHELLKAHENSLNARQNVPACPVPFLNQAYMDAPESPRQGHGLSWPDWLASALGVRSVPRLKFDGGSLSNEFRHIIRYWPEKLVGTLEAHWTIYKDLMTPGIVDALSSSEVACKSGRLRVMKDTFLPLRTLTNRVQALGINQKFPFLKLPHATEDDQLSRCWNFLAEFGVGSRLCLSFFVEILRQHESKTYHNWAEADQNNILRTYEAISDYCSPSDVENLREEFDKNELILEPRSFEDGATRPMWTDLEACVWNGPVDLIHLKPLASVSQYRDNLKVAHLFSILSIRDANWQDYLDMLLELQDGQLASNSTEALASKVRRLYEHLASEAMGAEDWAHIRDTFEEESLIYMPSSNTWFSPSECLWTSPVAIPDTAIIEDDYPEESRHFFVHQLRISAASLGTLVNGLISLVQKDSTTAQVKEMIQAINSKRPKDTDLQSLQTTNCLPVRHLQPNGTLITSFESCQTQFVVNDRRNLAEIFHTQVPFLDFTLEEVLQLRPFLEALQLDQKYLSVICEHATACDGTGTDDIRLTTDFRERAYEILRCAEFYGTSLDKHELFERLQRTSILKSDDISTEHTLRLADGIRSVHIPRGYVHVKYLQNSWEIFVPRFRRDRGMCYTRELPIALAKALLIPTSAKGILGNVLNGPLSILEEILDNEGIGHVQGIQQPTRPDFDDEVSDDQNNESRRSRTQSAATTIPQSVAVRGNSPNFSEDTSSEGGASPVDTEISTSGSMSHRQFEDVARRTPLHVARESSIFISGPVSPRVPRSGEQDVLIRAVADPRNNYTDNSYRNLLDNVIRIAAEIQTIPRLGTPISRGNLQHHDDFEHAAAFGVRSQGQMNHDIKIGAAGELLVFEIMSNIFLPLFGRGNWKSTIRHEVSVHEKYRDMSTWTGRETADITYDDDGGVFTSILVDKGYLHEYWRGSTPHYFIEVKTTTGDCNDRFFLSNSQYARMQSYTIPPGEIVPRVYIICRVFNLGKENLNFKIYVDPEAHRRTGGLVFEAQTWTVSPSL
ncbi:hypothetical protein BKA64DRAFT_378000 [Cadophora sp. MPI-SDFR-AT-0126]|nr:hypothetical protein BKA64DRAFT_378000 [Leotiomycetes sp. MPI-SDFR-AT-0126]